MQSILRYCGSRTLLKDILRDEFGFEGHVVSDCWAILDFHEHHHVTDTVEESAAMAVNNGCDLNCGSAFLHLKDAYDKGLVSDEAITAAVERLMEVRIRLGMMKDYPSPYEDISYEVVECKEHVELSVEAARRSLVLLKNKDNFLPLDRKNVKTIAVIGPNANSRDALIGNYYGTSSRYITPLEGLQQYLGEDTRVLYAEGCHLYKDKVQGLAEEKDRFKEALIMAEQSDVVVMCLGLDATIEGEEGDAGNEYASGDKLGLMLPGLQEELLEAVAAVGKPVILVLSAGSAIDLSWAEEHVDAIIDSWYPGARGGKAVAEAIFGEYSPSGKLPVTFYQGTENLPEFTDYSMEVFVNVTNDSRYTVNEIVQLYIRHVDAAEYEPGYQLKGIEVVKLEPYETKKVKLTLSPRDFAVIEEDGSCVAVPGIYEISAGGQQPDDRSTKLTGKRTERIDITRCGEKTGVDY